MNTSFLAMGIALLMTVGLLLGVVVLNLLCGTFSFLFSRPRIQILKSDKGESGFAFSFSCGTVSSDDRFDQVRIRLYNPFGNPDQVDVFAKFPFGQGSFARDVEIGPGYRQLLDAKNASKATIQIEISQKRGNVVFDRLMPVKKFFREQERAELTVKQFEGQNPARVKKYYHTPKRDFIAPPIPQKNKALKLSTNPEFAADFAGGAEADATGGKENFSVSKVWDRPGLYRL